MTITLSTYLSQGYIVCSCLFKVIFRVPIGSLVPGLPFPVYCMSRMPDNAVTIARLVLSQIFIGLAGCARPIRVIDKNFHYRLRLSTGVSVKLINKILCTLYIQMAHIFLPCQTADEIPITKTSNYCQSCQLMVI